MKNRNYEIDTIRGLACVLLVVYHVLGGLKLSDGFLKSANEWLNYLFLPMFAFASGYVYAYSPFKSEVYPFVRGKFRRLIIPMLVVGTLFAVVQWFMPGSNNKIDNWFLLHSKPYAHFWFIESLFLIFIVMIPLEFFKLLQKKINMQIVFIIASLIYLLSGINIHWLSITGAIYLFPFFLLGLYISRFSLLKNSNKFLGWFIFK